MSILEAIIIAIVEGLTEFIPVSSTGHMIIASSLMGINKDEFTKLFEVCVQLGAILAVVSAVLEEIFFNFGKPHFYIKTFPRRAARPLPRILYSWRPDRQPAGKTRSGRRKRFYWAAFYCCMWTNGSMLPPSLQTRKWIISGYPYRACSSAWRWFRA